MIDHGNFKTHSHEAGQIFIVFEGLYLIKTENSTWYIPPKYIGWIPPFKKHGVLSFENQTPFFFHISPSMTEEFPAHCCVFLASPLLMEIFKKVETWQECDFSQEINKLDIKKQRILQVLIDEITQLKQQDLFINMPKNKRLNELALHILSHPNDKTTLAEWQEKLKISSRTLTRRFKEETGMSITFWRQQVRLLKSLEMIADGQNVSEISFKLGYENVSAFIAVFKKYFGTTPGNYYAKKHSRDKL